MIHKPLYVRVYIYVEESGTQRRALADPVATSAFVPVFSPCVLIITGWSVRLIILMRFVPTDVFRIALDRVLLGTVSYADFRSRNDREVELLDIYNDWRRSNDPVGASSVHYVYLQFND